MSRTHHDSGFPPRVLWAATALVALTVAGALLARAGGVGATRMADTPRVELRELRFADRADGGIDVFRVDRPQPAFVLAPGGDGFVRGVLRGLARERKRRGVAQEVPYRLERWADGRLTILDPATGRGADLGAFGPANFGAFRRLFDATRDASGSATALAVATTGNATIDSPGRE
ncbi:MAG: photosynthetic complex assembly protein PuhC [Gammaproteobacteria bacterium]